MTQETSTWLYKRRYARNIAAKCLGTLATLFGLFWLIWILWTCLKYGVSALKPEIFYQMTPPPGEDGGCLLYTSDAADE